jgi:hypothetical protein
MNELGGALRELAREPEPAVVDADDLWARGRQRVRRHRVAMAAVTVVLALLAGATASLSATDGVVMPAGPPHAPGLPRNVYQPPAWLADTTGTGAFGHLAVVGAAPRHGRMELFGISATTGEYRFLDLPYLATVEGAALSPDGTHVAFWSTDGVSGKPLPTSGQKVVSGLSVLDLADGSVDELSPYTEHGLGVQGIRWLDRSTLLFVYGQKVTATATTDIRPYTWSPPGADTMVEHRVVRKIDLADASRNRDGTLLAPGDPWVGVDTQLRPTGRVVRLPNDENSSFRIASLSGRLVAAIGYVSGGQVDRLYAGTTGPDGGVVGLHPVPGVVGAGALLGWTGPDTVLVSGWTRGANGTTSLLEVDLVRGTVHRMGQAGDDVDSIVGVATDLLGEPFVDGRRPPRLNPWYVRAAAAGLLVLAAVGFLWWRRRAAV